MLPKFVHWHRMFHGKCDSGWPWIVVVVPYCGCGSLSASCLLGSCGSWLVVLGWFLFGFVGWFLFPCLVLFVLGWSFLVGRSWLPKCGWLSCTMWLSWSINTTKEVCFKNKEAAEQIEHKVVGQKRTGQKRRGCSVLPINSSNMPDPWKDSLAKNLL